MKIRFLACLALLLAMMLPRLALAQCSGPGGVPFNCAAGGTPQSADYVLGGSISGANTVRWTLGQVFGNAPTVNTVGTGYQQGGQTILQVYGNSGNMFGDGPNTDTLVGIGAGQNLPSTDFLTTAVGWHALYSSTQSNTESTAVGWNSQAAITTGDMNTSLGINTLGNCVTCFHTITVGTDAMRNVTAVNTSIAIGIDAMINSGDNHDIAIGDGALQGQLTSTGHDNIAIGWNGLASTVQTTGSNNISIGNSNGSSFTTANDNVLVGHNAGLSLTTGGENVFLGRQAGQLATTATQNVAVGYGAGDKLTIGANFNTILGNLAGNATLATGIGNILIGNQVDTATSATNYTLCVGYGANCALSATGLDTATPSVSALASFTAAAYKTTTNCASGASPAVCAAASSGSSAVPTGTNPTLMVNTSQVTANSVILVTSDESLGTKLGVTCNTTITTQGPIVVTARSVGVSFTVQVDATVATNPVCFNWMVVN